MVVLRRQQVVDLDGVLFGGVNTTVTSATGPPRVGIAYFAVGAVGSPFGIIAHILHQGYVAVNGENVLFPSIAVNRAGVGAMAFTLSGPDFFPSAAYVRFALGRAVGPIRITGPGALPEDGFTGYAAEGSPTPGVARWGDYSAAVFADGAIWMGNEFIPNAPRTLLANWGTLLGYSLRTTVSPPRVAWLSRGPGRRWLPLLSGRRSAGHATMADRAHRTSCSVMR
jgi:hypothetical protein